MSESLLTLVLGFVSGVLSGMFGIGGGVITTPAIRLLLDAPALVAVGTPLAAIVPSTLTGAWQYARRGEADVRSAVVVGLAGCVTAVAGAAATRVAGGPAVLIATAGVITYMAFDMALQVRASQDRPVQSRQEEGASGHTGATRAQAPHPSRRPSTPGLVACGVITGFYSGFLGLGGGFVLVPLLTRWMDYTMKRAVGTSLVSISILALPGLITHALIGNIDVTIAVWLTVGVVPGAALGARTALGTSDRTLRVAFSAVLVLAAAWLAITEIQGLRG